MTAGGGSSSFGIGGSVGSGGSAVDFSGKGQSTGRGTSAVNSGKEISPIVSLEVEL